MTAAGQLQIGDVTVVPPSEITSDDAMRAGYASREALLAELERRHEGRLYRIEIGPLRPDPRAALRETAPDDRDVAGILERLDRFDVGSARGPWTRRTLRLIGERPGARAAELAAELGQELLRFKRRVRKLKSLGLTESLALGYRLSPRGAALLDRLDGCADPDKVS